MRKRDRERIFSLIKEALGHSSVSTTEIYANLGDGEYKQKMRNLIN